VQGEVPIHWDAAGLVPGIVQDGATGEVLMLAYLDAEALDATIETGLAHFHSRSRRCLWKKGETSGNTLAVRAVRVDCDGDALLIVARPAGPTCHTGAASCFEGAPPPGATSVEGFAWLETLWTTIVERSDRRPPGSYTVRLLDGGVDAASRKVIEEAAEVILAAKDDAVAEAAAASEADDAAAAVRAGSASPGTPGTREATQTALASEMADLLYHALVLCRERGLPPSTVLEILRARHGS
jgi:phosphoribosyl-ATP pyrophosphohydrolase/phosphoribosyl-AMP cyclohydrolase